MGGLTARTEVANNTLLVCSPRFGKNFVRPAVKIVEDGFYPGSELVAQEIQCASVGAALANARQHEDATGSLPNEVQ